MLSLKKLRELELTPVLEVEEFPILDQVDDEEYVEPPIEWYVPKKSFADILLEREGLKVSTEWDLTEIETFFDNKKLPKTLIFGPGVIEDVKNFVSSHLELVKNNNGNKYFLPYLNRLNAVREMCN